MSEWIDTTNTAVTDCRSSLIAGGGIVPISLGLTARAPQIDRAERDCLGLAFPALAAYVGPAARVIEIGLFAGHVMAMLLNGLERPKAGIVMTANIDARLLGRIGQTETTAQVSYLSHDAIASHWPLETMGAGKTLVFIGGGGFGAMQAPDAFAVLENASQSLCQGDLVALTLEMDRDGASLDAIYADFGSQVVTHALTSLGRPEGLDARSFYDGATHTVRFGALALEQASISWNGTRCAFEQGAWLDVGAMTLFTPATLMDLHPDFDIQDQWQSQDKAVTLLLLRKT